MTLTPAAAERVAAVARRFRTATGRMLGVTSGTRNAAHQASAMYDKLLLGSADQDYHNGRNYLPIRTAYFDSRAAGDSRAETERKMAVVIQGQVDRGIYVSPHLRSGAVDFRTRDLSAAEIRALETAVRAEGGNPNSHEGPPPHLHANFP